MSSAVTFTSHHRGIEGLSLLLAMGLHAGVILALFLMIEPQGLQPPTEIPLVVDLASLTPPEVVPPKAPQPPPQELAPPDPSRRAAVPTPPTEPTPQASAPSASPPPEPSKEPAKEPGPDYLPQFQIDQLPEFPTQQILSRVVYPPLAASQGLEVTVILELSIDKGGVIRKIEVLKDPGYGFSEAAIQALSGIQVIPAQARGEPVAVRYRYPIRFTLH